jgi:hypothetical protein
VWGRQPIAQKSLTGPGCRYLAPSIYPWQHWSSINLLLQATHCHYSQPHWPYLESFARFWDIIFKRDSKLIESSIATQHCVLLNEPWLVAGRSWMNKWSPVSFSIAFIQPERGSIASQVSTDISGVVVVLNKVPVLHLWSQPAWLRPSTLFLHLALRTDQAKLFTYPSGVGGQTIIVRDGNGTFQP